MKLKVRSNVMLIIMLVLALQPTTCFAQSFCIERNHRFTTKPNVSSYSTCEPIRLHGIEDTLRRFCVGIVNDSIDINHQDFIIYVYGLNDDITSHPELSIGFSDGFIENVKPIRVLDSINYVEFLLTKEQLYKLRANRFDYFSINSKDIVRPWIDLRFSDREYFQWFLNNYRKRLDVEVLSRYTIKL